MASSSSSSSRQLKHQVFLSFRGEDTRHNFTSHLLKALKDKGINVFFDEETLERGEELFKELLKAIASSYTSIIVLSVDYASSKSCLAELSEIMDCKRTEGQIALPIFYHVEPSDVRNLDGSFKTSFDEHESKRPDEVQRWKIAFAEVGKLKGWHIKGGLGSETEYIEDIVKVVIKMLNSKCESGSGELVGINDQKQTILRLVGQEDTRAIGIWGMGGIGKTTLAEAVYHEVFPKFAGHWFLQNVRDKLEKQGMESLRNELVSKLLDDKIHIDTPSIGYPLIQDRLHNKRVFVVLDDVNDSEQIECFPVKHFGQGSKILVTSRDKQVLKNGVDQIHGVKGLNEDDSLQLFSKFAFKQLYPVADFLDLSNKFVEYAQGCPLALKVLGSNLYLKPREEWESALDKLTEYPESKIIKVLKISFDGLDELCQNIFLDIACFFNRNGKDFVVKILSGCYDGALCGISSLVDKCLLNIVADDDDWYESISMHDLLEEMGMDIVRQESKDRGKRSRLWRPKDVYDVLKYNKGTESIEGIMLDMSQIDALQFCPTVFENMHNLRVLKFYFPENTYPCNEWLHADQVDLVSLPDELRCLWWDCYPFKSLPSNFNPKNLVVLRLRDGDVEQLWNEDNQDLVNLRQIDLTRCTNLRKIPNLLGAINLKDLFCTWCESLVELPCLNHLTSLESLDLSGCESLVELPCLNHLTSLETLDLCLCESLVELPCLNHLTSLTNLFLHGCKSLVELPCLNHLTSLETLDLRGCESLVELPCLNHLTSPEMLDLTGCESLVKLPCLNHLTSLPNLFLRGCKSLVELPCLNHLTSLEMLVVSGCESLVELSLEVPSSINLHGCQNFTELNSVVPSSISRFKNLFSMQMNHCKSLKLLSELPPSLTYLDAHNCTSLEKVSFTDQYLYKHSPVVSYDNLMFSNCFNLNQDSVDNIVENAMCRIESQAKLFAGKHPDDRKKVFCCLSGNEISANKFKYQSTNSSIVLEIGPNSCSGSRFLVFALCLVVNLNQRHKYEDIGFICEYQLKATGGDYEKFKGVWRWKKPYYKSEYIGDHVLVLFSGDMVKKDKDYEEASFEFYIKKFDFVRGEGTEVDDIKVEKCGVHVFYVDAESYTDSDVECDTDSDVESSESFNSDETGNDESSESFNSNIEKVHDDSTRPGHKRSLSYDGKGEGEGGPKRLK